VRAHGRARLTRAEEPDAELRVAAAAGAAPSSAARPAAGSATTAGAEPLHLLRQPDLVLRQRDAGAVKYFVGGHSALGLDPLDQRQRSLPKLNILRRAGDVLGYERQKGFDDGYPVHIHLRG